MRHSRAGDAGFSVRLRRPHGSANRRVRLRVLAAATRRRARQDMCVPEARHAWTIWSAAGYLIERGAKSYARRHGTRCPAIPIGHMIALAIRRPECMMRTSGQLFARTGVSHLMSISGLHVTMVASLLAALVYWLCGAP